MTCEHLGGIVVTHAPALVEFVLGVVIGLLLSVMVGSK